jgi:predicted MFS family arabinose efflux permease
MSSPDPAALQRLTAAGFAAHAADQLIFAALPLIAVLLGHGPGTVGVLVGVQSSSWLLVSLPAGRWADRLATGTLVLRALAASFAGLAIGAVAASVGATGAMALAGVAVAGAAATVAVAAVAAVPRLAPPPLARANARIELARAVASLGAPLAAGLLAGLDAALPFAAAAALILIAAPVARRLPRDDARPAARASGGLGDAALAVWQERRLRAVAGCAIAWNFGFFALAGIFVPLAAARGLAPAAIGVVLSCYGAGLILGALAAPRVLARATREAVLVFGPASSILGAALIAAAPWAPALAAGQFLLGFGPMLWMVARTVLLQAVTRPDQRGSVAGVMQVSVFGIRPIGALAGAGVAAAGGVEAALALALAAFAVSLVVILASPAGALRRTAEAQ